MKDDTENRSLYSGFLVSCEKYPGRPALEVDGQRFTYKQLRERACALAVTLQKHQPNPDPPLTAVLAHRSVTAFSGILGALLRGTGYVPLNPNFPVERTALMLERSGCGSIIVGEEAIRTLEAVLSRLNRSLLVVLPANKDLAKLRAKFPTHTFLSTRSLHAAAEWKPTAVDPRETAYLLFTSGSTGVPKGVPVSHSNIIYFIDVAVNRYNINENDRFSQMFELVFDLSLFDFFVAWERGACVCCPNQGDAQLPAKFVVESEITIWFSVPSLAFSMKRMRMLEPELYPNLRLTLFCGEALLADVANQWSKAAPNSIIENLYGPTEVTLACTLYRWDSRKSPKESEHGLVPIGEPFPGMTAIVVDEDLREVSPGQTGELLMTGPQVAPGYWKDPEKTAAAFVTPPEKASVHYRTGDLVRRPRPGEPLKYVGRIDHQIKIRGNRVELGEIEAVLREAAGIDIAVAVGWPITAGGADGIVAFLGSKSVDLDSVREKAKLKLPSYMMPREYRLLADVPLNANGKVDRGALTKMLGEPI